MGRKAQKALVESRAEREHGVSSKAAASSASGDSARILKAAIVGCGQIADAHLQELRKISGVTTVATCDTHLDLAMQAAKRFAVPRYYDDVSGMLRDERPDIVHIATPAQTHAPLARQCMEAGAHVYIEKPLALDAVEVREILSFSQSLRRKVCVGHDQLFDPAWLDLRRRVSSGEIGKVRHVDSVLGYPFSAQFGSVVRGDGEHWVRKLPGGLFQNTISHPLYRITEFLVDGRPEVVARWWARADLDFPTELLVHLRGVEVTGTLTFTTAIAAQRVTRVYGEKGALEVDLDAQTVLHMAPAKLPGAFAKLEAPRRRSREAARSWRRNAWRFLRSDIHYFAGMRHLFELFQQSVRDDAHPLPIAPAEMLRVTRIMDDIFAECRRGDARAAPKPRDESNVPRISGSGGSSTAARSA